MEEKPSKKDQRLYNAISIFSIVMTVLIFSLFLYKLGAFNLQEEFDNVDEMKRQCEELSGIVEREDEPLTPFSFECVGYDEDGFKFYWHKNENGEYYKTR